MLEFSSWWNFSLFTSLSVEVPMMFLVISSHITRGPRHIRHTYTHTCAQARRFWRYKMELAMRDIEAPVPPTLQTNRYDYKGTFRITSTLFSSSVFYIFFHSTLRLSLWTMMITIMPRYVIINFIPYVEWRRVDPFIIKWWVYLGLYDELERTLLVSAQLVKGQRASGSSSCRYPGVPPWPPNHNMHSIILLYPFVTQTHGTCHYLHFKPEFPIQIQ